MGPRFLAQLLQWRVRIITLCTITLRTPRPSKTNRFRRSRSPMDLHRCLRFYARVLDLAKSTGQGVDRIHSHLQLTPGHHPRLCMPVDLPPLQFNSQTIPIRLGFQGNILLLRRVLGMTRHISLLPAILLLVLVTPLLILATPLLMLATLLPILVTPLLVSVTLLLGCRIHHQEGSPTSSKTLTSLTLCHQVTQDLGFSHHPTS